MKGVVVQSIRNKPTRAFCNKKDCGFSETWSTEQAAQAAACWHVFSAHPEDWKKIMGHTDHPQDPLPGTLGEWLV